MSTTRFALFDRLAGKYLRATNAEPAYTWVNGPLQDPSVWYDETLATEAARDAGGEVDVIRWHREGR